MRFRPLEKQERIEEGRLYRTRRGVEVGPLKKHGVRAFSFYHDIDPEDESEDGYAAWSLFGTPENEQAKEMGHLVAVEAKTVEEALGLPTNPKRRTKCAGVPLK